MASSGGKSAAPRAAGGITMMSITEAVDVAAAAAEVIMTGIGAVVLVEVAMAADTGEDTTTAIATGDVEEVAIGIGRDGVKGRKIFSGTSLGAADGMDGVKKTWIIEVEERSDRIKDVL